MFSSQTANNERSNLTASTTECVAGGSSGGGSNPDTTDVNGLQVHAPPRPGDTHDLDWPDHRRNLWTRGVSEGDDDVPQVEVQDSDSDILRRRMTIALDDDFHDHPDMAALYEQKLSIEGTSPKPCIVPGNALQLIDDSPTHTRSRSHTPSSVIILDSDHDRDRHGQSTTVESSADQDDGVGNGHGGAGNGGDGERRPVPRVRFRSRVRITSGLRRSKHLGHPTSSPSSSASGSPSSSISAPIRWQADENGAWGPLGRRLSAYAQAHGRPKRSLGLQRALNGQQQQQPQARAKMDVSERTPLIKPGRHTVAYVDAGLDGGASADDEGVADGEVDSEVEETHRDITLRKAALKREEDAVFGKWPWRLFNRHWWWWHIEPVLCICCGDDSDYEDH